MNIKSFFAFEQQKDAKYPRINITDRLTQTLSDILTGRKTKFTGDLAKSFGIYFRKLNLSKSDPLVLTLFCILRRLRIQKPPESIKALIYLRSKLNAILGNQYKTEESIILSLLFENCYHIIFNTTSKEEIILRLNYFCVFFEEIVMHTNISNK